MRPFGMSAGPADHAIKAGIQRQRARDLDRLALHQISGAGLGQAGGNVQRNPGVAGWHSDQCARINGRARDSAIRRDDDTAGDYLSHSGRKPRLDQSQKRVFKAVRWQVGAKIAGRMGDRASRPHCGGAQVGDAPVNGDPIGGDLCLGHSFHFARFGAL